MKKRTYRTYELTAYTAFAKGKKMTFKSGVYSASVKLAPGSYQYKFVVDGIWCADPENANAVPNDQGTFNSVITVE